MPKPEGAHNQICIAYFCQETLPAKLGGKKTSGKNLGKVGRIMSVPTKFHHQTLCARGLYFWKSLIEI